ncbi:MAG TPA: nitrate reductase subunit beta, partial [Rhodocyclaceae bacterium]|nr:nitrate reductase subunit beta [Rhodocyclaceae bacterium]
VESKPGIGYPKEWENQEKWKGGWTKINGKLELKAGGKLKKLIQIFANPNMPQIDDYYEPFTYDHARLQNAPLSEAAPTARPISLITGEKMDKITWGPNWEDDLAGEFHKRAKDQNFSNMEKEIYKSFENTFHLYLPRICNHCINPACVASCPSGALYKREEDGIVLADQDRCRGWRMCISGCPYKKVFFNWESSKAEKCIGCYPRVESGLPTVCSESCVGRIRYNGIILYDADKVLDAASTDNDQDLYKAHLDIFVDPFDPKIIEQAKKDGIPQSWIEAAQKSPIYKMAVEWKIAFPLHPEFRTLPMVWYVPPLSPVQSQIDQKKLPTESDGCIPKAEAMRLPVKYLANLLTAGREEYIVSALNRMIAMRSYQRSIHVEGKADTRALVAAGITEQQAKDMYRYLAIANYEDRFVIPTSHQETHIEDYHGFQGQNGFTFGNDSSSGISMNSLFPERRKETIEPRELAPFAAPKDY